MPMAACRSYWRVKWKDIADEMLNHDHTLRDDGRQGAHPDDLRSPHGRSQTTSAAGGEFRGSLIVELYRSDPSADLGLVVTGGADKDSPARVAYLKPGSVAYRSDALELGDYIVSINGVHTALMKHNELVSMLQNSSANLTTIQVEYSLPEPQQMSFSVLCKRIELVLVRDSGGTFGMTLRGGASTDPGKCRPLTVTQIRPGGPADREGTLKVGDRIVAVNGVSLIQRTLGQTLNFLREIPDDEVAFLVEYDVSVLEVVQNASGPLLVEIDKLPGNPLGITLAQGRYRGRMVLYIDSVTPASIADRCGALHVGDHVLSVDGVLFDDGLPVNEAMSVVSASSGSQVQLEIVPSALVRDQTEPVSSSNSKIAAGPVTAVAPAVAVAATGSSSTIAEDTVVPAVNSQCGLNGISSSSSQSTYKQTTSMAEPPVVAAPIICHHLSHGDPEICQPTAHTIPGGVNSGRLFSSVSMNSLTSSVLSQDTCSSMKTQVGSAVVSKYNGPLCGGTRDSGLNGSLPDRTGYSSLDRAYTWDSSLGRRSTVSGNSVMVACHQTAQVCHLDTTEVMLFADQHRRSLGGAAAYGLIIDTPGVTTVQKQTILLQPPVISYIEPKGPAERCGVLQEGDHILAINGQYLEGRTIDEVEQFIAESPVKMLLTVEFRVAESIIPSSGVFVVKLAKRGAGLGITISCPRNRRPGQHLIISDVKKGSVAHRTGSIQPGDQLLAIDNVRLDNCTLEDSARVLQDTHDIVKLTIKKDENFADEPDPTHLITYTVELPKFAGPLGITISGSEEPFDPVFISGLTEDGLAQKTGALHVGDRLLAINGVSLRGKTLTDAVHLLQNAGDTVTLKITRPANTRTRSVTATTPSTVEGKFYDSMDSALESWDSSGLEGNNVKANQRSRLKEPNPSDGSSSNGSNTSATVTNNSKNRLPQVATTKAPPGAGVGGSDVTQQPPTNRTAAVSESGANNVTATTAHRNAQGVGWDQASLSVSASAPPSCGSGGSVDDEWSRQMDELDRLRPSTADPTTSCSNGLVPGRSVIDFFTDLPDIVIDEEAALPAEQPINVMAPSSMSSSTPNVSQIHQTQPAIAHEEPGLVDCDQLSSVMSDVTTADLHLREVEEQLENIFTPTPIELLRVTIRRINESADFGFSLSDGVFEKGVYVSAVRPGGPATDALKPYDRILQVNQVRTKDLDCCQVVPLIIQTIGNEIHLVISRNPLVWGREIELYSHGNYVASASHGPNRSGRPVASRSDSRAVINPPPSYSQAVPVLYDGNRGITR